MSGGGGGGEPKRQKTEAVKYGDIFKNVHGELAYKPIVPRDAATMQAAEKMVLGQAQKGSIADVMQSVAAMNELTGAVSHDDTTDVSREHGGVTITDTTAGGIRVITESIGDQVLGQYTKPAVELVEPTAVGADAITIGEALEAAGRSSWDKPVEKSDAAAIKAAEIRSASKGTNEISPDGIGGAAQAAADRNERAVCDEDKIKLGEILENASCKLDMGDKAATREDAEVVIAAEIRNDPTMATHHCGVAETVAAAARLNTK
ncbi:late embryogenesis abundant protein D-34-like [Impatiens glandulifera]|uniref:late embryogenesis abundant protein D-34-like n=1 Tax=Impatiens glandulifera TaxID=253017 RepID=UPI001FB06A90|nr:late embryogenesis abundant protein D-34-like [Impatiens glandulifera]